MLLHRQQIKRLIIVLLFELGEFLKNYYDHQSDGAPINVLATWSLLGLSMALLGTLVITPSLIHRNARDKCNDHA